MPGRGIEPGTVSGRRLSLGSREPGSFSSFECPQDTEEHFPDELEESFCRLGLAEFGLVMLGPLPATLQSSRV